MQTREEIRSKIQRIIETGIGEIKQAGVDCDEVRVYLFNVFVNKSNVLPNPSVYYMTVEGYNRSLLITEGNYEIDGLVSLYNNGEKIWEMK